MPLLLVLPLLAGGVGFAGGYFTGTSFNKIAVGGLLAGGLYYGLKK